MPIGTKAGINYFDAIQLISLSNLYNLKNDKPTSHEYDINRICRYYAKKFNTPLHVVRNELPLHDVLTAYFDDLFEGMDDDVLEDTRLDLLKSQEERNKDKDAKDLEEVDIFDIMKETALEAEALSKKMGEMVKAGMKPLVSNKGDVPLENPLLPKAMQDIKIKFLTEQEMQANLNKDSLGLLEDP